MLKGFISDLGMTMILLLIAAFIGCAFVIFGIITQAHLFGASPVSYSLEYVNQVNRPYIVSEVLSHYQANDRQFIEHALEMVITGDSKKSGSVGVDDFAKDFLDNYKMVYYKVSIKDKNNNDLMAFSNVDKLCGKDNKGTCTSVILKVCIGMRIQEPIGALIAGKLGLNYLYVCETKVPKSACGTGRVQIDDVGKNCGTYDVCCMENIKNGRNVDENGNPIPNCGPEGHKVGVCDDIKLLEVTSANKVVSLQCREGRQVIDTVKNYCPDGSVCCLPRETASVFNLLTDATMPILYKNGVLGSMEVTTGV